MVGGLPTTRPFVLPYKRFATETLISRAKDYLENSRVTYRRTVRHERCLIGYPLATPTTSTTSTADTSPPHQPVVDLVSFGA